MRIVENQGKVALLKRTKMNQSTNTTCFTAKQHNTSNTFMYRWGNAYGCDTAGLGGPLSYEEINC